MEILLGTKIYFNGVEIGDSPRSINFVRGAELNVTVDDDANFTITIPQGSQTYFTATVPDAGVGISGDFALTTDTTKVYTKNGSSWILVT